MTPRARAYGALVGLLVLASAGGCTGTLAKGERSELAEIIKASAKDPATWCLTVVLMTPWGTEQSVLTRSPIANGTVTCDKNGLTVKSDGAAPIAPPR